MKAQGCLFCGATIPQGVRKRARASGLSPRFCRQKNHGKMFYQRRDRLARAGYAGERLAEELDRLAQARSNGKRSRRTMKKDGLYSVHRAARKRIREQARTIRSAQRSGASKGPKTAVIVGDQGQAHLYGETGNAERASYSYHLADVMGVKRSLASVAPYVPLLRIESMLVEALVEADEGIPQEAAPQSPAVLDLLDELDAMASW